MAEPAVPTKPENSDPPVKEDNPEPPEYPCGYQEPLQEPELEEYVRPPCIRLQGPKTPAYISKPKTPEEEPDMPLRPCPLPLRPPCFKPVLLAEEGDAAGDIALVGPKPNDEITDEAEPPLGEEPTPVDVTLTPVDAVDTPPANAADPPPADAADTLPADAADPPPPMETEPPTKKPPSVVAPPAAVETEPPTKKPPPEAAAPPAAASLPGPEDPNAGTKKG